MATEEAIASATAAGTSSDIPVDSGASIQVWTDVDLAEGERVEVYRTDDAGTEEVLVRETAGPVMLTAHRPSVMLNGPAVFRLKKSVTASATAVLYDA